MVRLPSLGTWGRIAASIGAAAVAWVTMVTTLDSQMLSGLHLEQATQFAVAALVTIMVAVAVWFLGQARDSAERRRDAAFANVLKTGNELFEKCHQPKPEGLGSEAWLQTLMSEWIAWDGTAWAVVKEWGSEADQEIYSAHNPLVPHNRDGVKVLVGERLERLREIVRRRA